MAHVGRRIRGRAPTGDYWPGFVDAMSSLLLVLIFLLTIFMITQFFLNQLVSSKDSALENLRSQIAELVSQLALERREKADLQATIMSLQDSLAAASAATTRAATACTRRLLFGNEFNWVDAENRFFQTEHLGAKD